MMRFLNELIQRKKVEHDFAPVSETRALREGRVDLTSIDDLSGQRSAEPQAVSAFDRFAANGAEVRDTGSSGISLRKQPVRVTPQEQLNGDQPADAETETNGGWSGFSASVDQINFSRHRMQDNHAEVVEEDETLSAGAPEAEEEAFEASTTDTLGDDLEDDLAEDLEDLFVEGGTEPEPEQMEAEAEAPPNEEEDLLAGSEEDLAETAEADALTDDDAVLDEDMSLSAPFAEEETAEESLEEPAEEPLTFAAADDDADEALSDLQPEAVTERSARLHIWDVDTDETMMETPEEEVPTLSSVAEPQSEASGEDIFARPDADEAPRRAGRVRTRLLGFHRPEETAADPFARPTGKAETGAGMTFPVGWLVIEKGPGRGAHFALSDGVSKIGRGEDQAIQLDFGDTSVSRDNHAVIAYDNEQRTFFLGHGGKANLVRRNGMPVLSTEVLNDGDKIRLGETTLRFVALCGEEFDWLDGSDLGGLDVAAG